MPEKLQGAATTSTAAEDTRVLRAQALRKAAKALVAQWDSSGFYDRQDPALALALHEALDA